MSNRFEQLATRIFETLKGYGYTLNVYDEEGNKIFVPRNGRAFFSQNEDLAVYIFENGIDSDIKIFLSGEVDPFLKLLTNLRKTAIKYRVNFTVRKYGGSIRPKDFAFMAADIVSEGSDSMEYKLDEGMTGTSRTSYQKIGETRLVIKHTAPVKETHGSRGRNIKAIFIETPDGERLKYPFNHLIGARAMARHISSNGSMRDPFGERIIGLSEDIRDLTKIGNYIWRTRIELDESSLEFRLVARERISSYKKTLESLCRPRGYETTKSILEEDDTEKLPDQNTIDEMRKMLKLEENDEFDQSLAKLAIVVKEAVSDPIDLEDPGAPLNRGFTDMDAGEADEFVSQMRKGKGLDSGDVEATGDRNAKIIRDAMGFTASGDFANVKMDELRATAANALVPGAEQWVEYKPIWDTIIKNGAPWGDPSDADWKKLQEMQEWVESLNTNLVGDHIRNVVLGAILIRISSALYSIMDKTLPSFDIIGAPFRKYLVPFFNLISGETIMETKTSGMPEEEQLNDWFDSFDPDRFLAARKSQYAKAITKKTEVIKESIETDKVEHDAKRSLSENQIWMAANKLAEDSENERLLKNYYNAFSPGDFQKIMETVRDTFKEDLARKVIEDAKRILKKKVTEASAPLVDRKTMRSLVSIVRKYAHAERREGYYHERGGDSATSRNAKLYAHWDSVMTKLNNRFWALLSTVPGANIPAKKDQDINLYGFDYQDEDPSEWINAWFENSLQEAVKDHTGQTHRSWYNAAVAYLVDTDTDVKDDYDVAYKFLIKNGRTEEDARSIATEISEISSKMIKDEMDEMHSGEESGIVIKHDAHDGLIDDIEFDAEDPSEIPFNDELVDDMYEDETNEVNPRTGSVIDEVVWIADKILDGDQYSLVWGKRVNLSNRDEVVEAAVRVYYGYEGEGLFPGARSADKVEELSQAVANRLISDITETSRSADIRYILDQIENISK